MRSPLTLAGVGLMAALLAISLVTLFSPAVVRAEDDHGDYRSLATHIAIGTGEISGNIDETSLFFDVDYFSFDAKRGVQYDFVLGLTGITDANLTVIDSADRGAGVAEGQTMTWDGDQKDVKWVARTNDTYFLEVYGAQGAPDGPVFLGSYTLKATSDTSLVDRHEEYITGATPIAIGNEYQGAVSPWPSQPKYAGSIQADYDRDYFSFRANRGVRYIVNANLGTVQGVEIAVSNETGIIEASNNGLGSALEWIAPATAIYYAVISGSALVREPVGTYTLEVAADLSLEDRHSGNRQGATPVSFGTQHQGAISPADDNDYFSFQAVRGVRYSFEVGSGEAVTGAAEGVDILVSDPAGKAEATNGGVGAILDWVAPSTAIYFVVVSGSPLVREPVGTYTLEVAADMTLEDRHSESREGATQISFGNAHNGSVSPKDDVDYFFFQAIRGVEYMFQADMGTSNGVSLSVLNPTDGVADTTAGLGDTLRWIAPATDTYYATVTGSNRVNDPVGTYSLEVTADASLEDQHSDGREGATAIRLGSAHNGAISPEQDQDYFFFRAVRGVQYDVQVKTGDMAGINIIVAQPVEGVELANSGSGSALSWIAPGDDTYFIALSASPQATNPIGTYSLEVTADVSLEDQHSDGREGATPIRLGSAHDGAISPEQDEDYFFFRAVRGVEYEIQVNPGSMAGIGIVVAHPVDGIELSNSGVGNTLSWIAPSDDTYFVALSASPQIMDPIGTYSLQVNANTGLKDQHSESREGATPLGFGTVYNGAISPQDDFDFFSFPAKRGIKYNIDAGIGATLSISVGNPVDGSVLSNEGGGPQLEWIATEDGTFFVILSGSTRVINSVGSYSLTVKADTALEDRHSSRANSATAISFGNSVSGAISPADDRDMFSFPAVRGVKYTFDLTYGSTEAVSLSVEPLDGGEPPVTANYGTETDVSWVASASGVYIVTVSSSPHASDPVGTYFLRVDAESGLKDRHSDFLTGATEIAFGNNIGGAISPLDDQDNFTFSAEKGLTYIVEVRTENEEPLRFVVTNAKSGFTDSNYGTSSLLAVTAPVTDTFNITVSAVKSADATVGNYQIIVTPDNLAPTINPPQNGQTFTMVRAASEMTLGAGVRVAPANGTVSVPIVVQNAEDVLGVTFSLAYDPEVVEVIGVTKGAVFSPATFRYHADDPGVIRFGFASNEPLAGGGSAAVVEFKAVGETGSSTQLTLSRSLVSDSFSRSVTISLADGMLTIGQRILGDADGDGSVTAVDGLIALRMAAQTMAVDLALDLDGDGTVTAEDARQVLALARPEKGI
ncbi:MAG: hypothetical protein BZY80_01560 [SAR202 cluster bacterium Io17-Chloro-G2]|nr:MAG: hypothetical protein BZY80_01560 [SAR202 cluster bacterium Io17-Chloro-G2]